ncbi:nickel pincer cofactor biosynthesis protein LarC [bacterium D16-54]|nr:nickel pincer cofactor biosynthesis protein LarC [bacterium D16-54]RKJ16322.1 nickel pincer cofactor biosynthesis protein LarC [bacterium D16-56]
MGKILYLECNSGISGDMTVGALLDLGADQETLKRALDSMGLEGYHLHFGRKEICGLDAFDFDVHLEEHKDKHGENHVHSHGEVHDHGHTDAHHHIHSHIHRNLYDVYEIIDRLDSNDHVKDLAKRMFSIVAEAEAKAHGLPIDQVHFHEVGAIDSIIDIVSVAVCVDNLGIEEVAVSPLCEGHGHVHCQHGILPVPVPATANIVSSHGLELRFTDNEGEMVTPTGAAIAAALRTKKGLPSGCRLLKIGMGAGNKTFRQANVLRIMLLEEMEEENEAKTTIKGSLEEAVNINRQMWVLEANLDDSTGEMLGFAMEALLEAGAADVWYSPIFMKKNRPAYQLSVLCKEDVRERLEDILFVHTTTIGIRRYPAERTVLERQIQQVETKYGVVDVKVCCYKNKAFCYPEYESIRKICRDKGIDFQSVYEEAKRAWIKD